MFIAGKTGHFRALGSRLCGSGGWVRKFLVPAHFRSFPSVASIQPDDRLLAGGLERALGSRLCGSGGWVRKFHVPDHFRSFPSVATGHAGAGCSLGDRYWDGFLPVREWRLGTEISCSRSFPLISERCLRSGGGRLLAGGLERRLVSACAGVAVGCVNFLFPDHFRSFPSVASIQAGAGCSLGQRCV